MEALSSLRFENPIPVRMAPDTAPAFTSNFGSVSLLFFYRTAHTAFFK